MAKIDEKLKEIEEFNNRDYGIDEEYLELDADIFEKYDEEILTQPFTEYSGSNLPSYYPENGIWFNQEEVSSVVKEPEMTEEEKQELENLGGEKQP